MRRFLWQVIIGFVFPLFCWATTPYLVTIETNLIAADSVEVLIFIQTQPGGPSFNLGACDFVVDFTPSGIIETLPASTTILEHGTWSGAINPANYNLMTATTVGNFLEVAVTPIDFTSGLPVPDTKTLVGRFAIKILNCNNLLTAVGNTVAGAMTSTDGSSFTDILPFRTFVNPPSLRLYPTISSPAPNTGDTTVCSGASFRAGSNVKVNWIYAAPGTPAGAVGVGPVGNNSKLSNPITFINSGTVPRVDTIFAIGSLGCHDTLLVTVSPIPTIISPTNNPTDTICSSTTPYTVGAGFSVNWLYAPQGGSITNQGTGLTASISIPNNPGPGNREDTIFATNGSGCVDTLRLIVKPIPPAPLFVSATPPAVLAGGTSVLNATPPGGASIVWFDQPTLGTELASGTSYTTPPLSATDTFWAAAVLNGCTSATRTSIQVTVTTCSGAFAGPLSPDTVVCRNTKATVYLKSYGGDTIRWQQSTTPTVSGSWIDVIGGIGKFGQVYLTADLTDTIYYRVIVGQGTICFDTSDTFIRVAVTDPPLATVATRISDVCIGDSTNLSISPGYVGSLQWQISPNGITGWSNINGATSATINTGPLFATRYYRARVKTGCDSAFTNILEVKVYNLPSGSVNIPQDTMCAGGTSVTFTGTASVGNGYWTTSGNGFFTAPTSTSTQYIAAGDSATNVIISWVVVSGNCSPTSYSKQVYVNSPPQGSFATVPDSICAGGSTLPLGAIVSYGSGSWSVSPAVGTFSNINDPNAVYYSSTSSAGSTVTLTWTVNSTSCPTKSFSQPLKITTDVIGGTATGPVPATICAGEITSPLGGSAIAGIGQWSSTGSGFFIPNNLDPNARYVSVSADGGSIVSLIWTVSNSKCKNLVINRPLTVSAQPIAVISNPVAFVCQTNPTPPLGAVAVNGIGQWSHNGSGSFSSTSNPNAFYTPSLADAGNIVRINWIVSSPGCKPDTAGFNLKVSRLPDASLGASPPPVCAGGATDILNGSFIGDSCVWRCLGGCSGDFSNRNDPQASYNSVFSEAGKTLTLRLVAFSAGCPADSAEFNLLILNNTINGSFNTDIPDICVGDTTILLTATGTGQWISDKPGKFIPSDTALSVRFIPDQGSIGRITIGWQVTAPGCAPSVYRQRFNVITPPSGSFNTILPPVCVGERSAPFSAVAINGKGRWEHTGNGAIIDPFATTTSYLSVPGDAGDSIRILWIVEKASCRPDTKFQFLSVLPAPSGGFPFAPADICVGSETDSLQAFTVFGTGRWRQIGGGGSFSDINNPNAVYRSVPSDAGKTITLQWIVESPGCKSDTNSQLLRILNQSMTASFPDIPKKTVCPGEIIGPLGASASGGVGDWDCVGCDSGSYFIDDRDPNTSFVVGNGSVGKTLTLIWRVIDTSGFCKTQIRSQNINVIVPPSGFIISNYRNICVGAVTDTLVGISNGDSAYWECSNCTGTISRIGNDSIVYSSANGDANKTLQLAWVVTKAGCAASRSIAYIYVFPKPLGTFNTSIPRICVGDTTIPLGATVETDSTLSYGEWACANCSGGFTLPLSGNSKYVSIAADGGDTLHLQWIVRNGGCDSVVFMQDLIVDSTSSGAFETFIPPVCAGKTTINLGAEVFKGNGKWQRNAFGTFSDSLNPNATFTPSTSIVSDTTIELEWRVTNGSCPPVIYKRRLLVVAKPIGSFNTRLDSLCVTDSTAPLGATARNGIGIWRTVNGSGYFSDPLDPNARYISVSADADKLIELQWTVSNGFCDSVTYSQPLKVKTAGLVDAGKDTTICSGDSIRLTATGFAVSYNWTSDRTGVIIDGNTATPLVKPSGTTKYILRTVDAIGCIATDTVEVAVTSGGSITLPSVYEICQGDVVRLDAGDAVGDYSWFPSTGLNDSTIANPVAQPISTTIYTLRARTTTGCFAEAQVEVRVKPFPQPTLPESIAVCQFSILALTNLNVLSRCDSIRWFNTSIANVLANGNPDDPGHPNFVTNNDSLYFLADSQGRFFVCMSCFKQDLGCKAYAQSEIFVAPPVSANFEANQLVVPYSNRRISFSRLDTSTRFFYWDFGDPGSDSLNNSFDPNPSHTFSSSGTYSIVLYAENELGCADLVIKSNYIRVLEEEFYFPTAFSPNGDGLNDRFRPLPLEGNAQLVSIQIFDRWGQKVFETSSNQGWDGNTTDGKPFDEGTYTYKALINLDTRGIQQYTGYITLLR